MLVTIYSRSMIVHVSHDILCGSMIVHVSHDILCGSMIVHVSHDILSEYDRASRYTLWEYDRALLSRYTLWEYDRAR